MGNTNTPLFDEAVLVLDDEEEVVSIVLECVAKTGVRAVGATSPSEAEHLLNSNNIFLILIDFRMPEEDGLSFFARTRERFPNLQGILVTGNADDDAAERAAKVGIADVIAKPFKISEIIGIVEQKKKKRLQEITKA